MQVLIALADVGPGVQLEEALQQAGFTATWDAAAADGPRGGEAATVVVIDADHLGKRMAEVAEAWRDHRSVPGIVAIGSSPAAREQAPRARLTLLASTAQLSTLAAAIRDAERLRLATGMRWHVMRAAAKLPPADNTPAAWQQTLVAARKVDIEIPRAALRWHAQHYATPTAVLDQLREERLLTVPELETSAHIDGASTIQTLVRSGPLDGVGSARMLWTLASMGAIDLTPEVRDLATPARRALDELRSHLRGRNARLEKSTYYDVLEIGTQAEYDEIEDAYQRVGWRYSPQSTGRYDLSDVAGLVQPMWDLVEKARGVLIDHAARGKYHDWLRKNLATLRTVWAIEPGPAKLAADAFARGQKALGEGDAHRAMSELATACRHHPGHPDYEANFAWARLRVQVASGKDQHETATAERRALEQLLLGCRPWPRALVALAMLCASGGDADSARWHLHVALQIDPNVPAGAALAKRLGLRR